MNPEQYPVVTALIRAVSDPDLHLSLDVDDDRLRSRSYRRIRMEHPPGGRSFSIAVDDEYGDVTDANPALLLHLVLAECEAFESAADFLVWARESGLDASESWVLALYRELGEVVPGIRELVGPDVGPVSSHDFGLNAGAARVLRGLAE